MVLSSKWSNLIQQKRSNMCLCIIFLLSVCGIYQASQINRDNFKINTNYEINENNSVLFKNKEEPTTMKTILYASTFFRMKDFKFGLGSEPFKQRGCKFDNCYLTDSTSEIQEENFDAIIFHGPEFQFKNIALPEKRKQSQVYVYLSMEAPIRFPVNQLLNAEGYFNATCTYRLDSDIPMPYYYIYNKNREIVAPKEEPEWIQLQLDEDFLESKSEIIKGKHRSIAWFVSNCNGCTNRRMEHVQELQKQDIDVDIYGKCGNLTCPNGDRRCFDMLTNDYFFYLAYENSNCVDYVSERFPLALKSDVVPIVYGGANYSKFAPPHSYIDASDYTAEGLAALVKFLVRNPSEYVKYFWWKQYYDVNVPVTPNFCGLCKFLNKKIESKSYKNMSEWWGGKTDHPFCKTFLN